MLTASQIAAVIMLLQAFGVAPAVVSNVYADLTHQSVSQKAPADSVVLPQPDQAASGVAGVGQAADSQTQPVLSCSLSLQVITGNGSPFVQVSWDFTDGAQGKFTSDTPVTFRASASQFPGGVKPSIYPLRSHSYNMSAVGFYTTAASTSVSLTVTKDGYQTANCSQGTAI